MQADVVDTAPSQGAASPDQVLERVRVVLGWLLDGVPAAAAIDRAQAEWSLGLRMAQLYVQRAKEMLAEEEGEEELLYYRKLSQQQRDRLIYVLLRALKTVDQMDPARLRALASVITSGTKLLESRDRLVLGEAKSAARERRREETARVNDLIEAGQELNRKTAALRKEGPTPTKTPNPSKRPGVPHVRPLEPGEPVFDRNNPLDEHKMTPRQREEWIACLVEGGNPCQFPWYTDNASDSLNPDNLELGERLLAQARNPASQISIVPEDKPRSVKRPTPSTQAKTE